MKTILKKRGRFFPNHVFEIIKFEDQDKKLPNFFNLGSVIFMININKKNNYEQLFTFQQPQIIRRWRALIIEQFINLILLGVPEMPNK